MPVFRRPSSGVPAGDAIPFAHDGRTHLFFLSSPEGTLDYPERVRTSWQHVVSDDLATWTELPPAVLPGEPGQADADGAWTGSVVEHEGTFFLFYTAHHLGAANPQTIALATSTDLVTFTKQPFSLGPPASCEPVDWRDPYVFFHPGEGRWWMVIAARLATGPAWRRGCLMLATSEDLRTWTIEDEPLHVPGTTYCPECPELWEDDGRWYLVWSRFSEQVGTVVRVADSARGPFRVPARDALGGRRWYAAKSAPVEGGRAFFGWIHDRAPDGRWCWGGDFAAARVAVPGPDGLAVRLAPAVEASFGPPAPPVGLALDAVGTAADAVVAAELPGPYLARCRLDWGAEPAAVGLTLRTDADGGGWYLAFEAGTVSLARVPGPLDDFWADLVGRGGERREVDGAVAASAPYVLPDGGVDLLLLVEGPLLEAYVAGTLALTARIDPPGGAELGVFVVDGCVSAEVTVSGGD